LIRAYIFYTTNLYLFIIRKIYLLTYNKGYHTIDIFNGITLLYIVGIL